jgi:NAD-dependent dihydropyrimidine dehydrogenase PreA subunit
MTDSPDVLELLLEHWHLARSLRHLEIVFNPEKCIGLYECYEVCPVDCWRLAQGSGRVEFIGAERCIACNACVLQCSAEAIELKVPG